MGKLNCLIFMLVPLFAAGAFPQRYKDKKTGTKFSSVYTNLKRDCRPMPGPAEVIKCKRVGSYYILVGYGAFTENVRVESPDRKISIQVSPSKGKNILPQSGGLIEWRLANGRPFAVIARFAFYDGEKILEALSRGETPFQADFKTGESFVAKGLTSKPQIDFEVWVNTPNARRKIRALVDGALNLPDVPLTLPVVPPPL